MKEPSGRDTLKSYFKAGSRPSQEQFEALIDSTVNMLDDGYSKNTQDGLKIAPKGNNKLMSFCQQSGEEPAWMITINKDRDLCIGTKDLFAEKIYEKDDPSMLLNTPKTVISGDVEIHGVKRGLPLADSYTPIADGKWHDITKDLYGIYAMEIVAHVVGEKGSGKYALLMAWTTHCYGSSKIRTLASHYGFFGHKLKLRWRKNKDHTYTLQIRTRLRYRKGDNIPRIHCSITHLYRYERPTT